ncbi:hypothetical protein G5C60_25770 [Streptomyces sp. HC44]|uniref:DUF5753 domain-containing protein n=2 Tax=Streptomyces scabichelini TaxID=2711217 RepID=A0A6G4VAS9_9ACTN|nr:hypothetical protein [Streptomyces scabichelini]
MLYVHGPVPQLDTVQLDTAHGGEFIGSEPLLKQYRKRYEKVVSTALEPGQSRDFITQILQEL